MTTANKKESNIISSGESNMNNTEMKNKNNQNGNLNSHINENSEIHADKEGEPVLQNLDLPVSKIDIEIEKCKKNGKIDKLNESPSVQAIETSECEADTTKTDLITSLVKNDNDKNETKYVENLSCDGNEDTKEIVMENKNHNLEQTQEILSDNCDNKQIKDMSEQENDVKHDIKSSPEEKEVNSVIISSSIDVYYTAEQNNELESENKALKEKEILTRGNEIAVINEKITINDKWDVTKCTDETQERTDNNEKENSIANSIVVDKIESLKEDLQVEEEKVASSHQN